jgi:hypothetical protein
MSAVAVGCLAIGFACGALFALVLFKLFGD